MVLGLSITVVQSPFTGLSGLRVEICHLLNAGMIIHSDNDHVRLLLPNLPSSMLQSLSLRRNLDGADTVMKLGELDL